MGNNATNKALVAVIIFILTLWVIWVMYATTVTGLKYRETTMKASAIDDINNTIISYIQKNGGYIEDPVKRADFENALLELHRLDSSKKAGCGYCVNIEVTPRKNTEAVLMGGDRGIQRDTIYDIKTSYRIYTMVFDGFFVHKGWIDAIPREAQSYVHQYINDGSY